MTEAPVGEWTSPITSETITSSTIGFVGAKAGKDGYIYFTERRPSEKGRSVIMRQKPGQKAEQVTPDAESGLNPRTRVHEYGGGETTIGNGILYFSNFADQRLYKQVLSPSIEKPEALTPADTGLRFAAGVIDAQRNRIIVVQEDHSKDDLRPTNTIAAIDLDTGASTILVSGEDFYASPALSKSGEKLAWIQWSLGNMPWDDTELWTADLDKDGKVQDSRKVAGGQDESVVQPTFTADDELVFISDRGDGWWNLYLETTAKQIKPLYPHAAEFAQPAWMLGMRSYSILSDGQILAQYSDPKALGSQLILIDPKTGEGQKVEVPYVLFSVGGIAETDGKVLIAAVGGSPTSPSVVTALELSSVSELVSAKKDQWQIIKKSSSQPIDPGYLSSAETIEFPTEGGKTAFLNYYGPSNKDFKLPSSELPPLLIKIHGGPTSQASTAFNVQYQYWTSRGFAIADVNYGGSTGYGRAYRQRLNGNWGIVDVDDCANAATYLAKQGKADPKRLTIDGGSAGGYTTLACLAFKDVFSAGASHYGVADCELLAQETHKFESRYLDKLIGPYPEKKAIYKERSPIYYTDKFKAPTILFQGLEDKIVPPNQAEEIYEKLKARGLVTSLVLFEGEQHGFRGKGPIRRALDGQLYFYGKALGFKAEMPTDVPAPEIVNL